MVYLCCGIRLENIDSITFLDIISSRADDAANIAKETGVRGVDAIVIQIAKEFGSPLISLDMEMIETAVASEITNKERGGDTSISK